MNQQEKKAKEHVFRDRLENWFHSPAFKCFLMEAGATILILILFLCVCTPKKYNVSVGSVSHETIIAPKDVIDEVATQEKRNAAAALVEPTYQFQQGVKEEVLSSLSAAFNELRTIQQYGMTLKNENRTWNGSFSEDEIDYAFTLTNELSLTRNQVITLLRVDSSMFEDMVTNVTTVVENSLNNTIREGQVSQSIQTILQIVGYKLDVSLTQNILPYILRTCIKPNKNIDEEATQEAKKKAMEAVEPVMLLQGQSIIREGDVITVNQVEMLRSLNLLNDNTYDYSSYLGSAVAVFLAMLCLFVSLRLLTPNVFSDVRKMAVTLLILILCIAGTVLAHFLPSLYIIPVALSSILGTVLIGYRYGISLTIAMSVIIALILSGNNQSPYYEVVLMTIMTLCEGSVSIHFLKGRPHRVRVLISGLLDGLVSFIIVLGMKWMTSDDSMDLLSIGVWSGVGGLLSGALAIALQPAFEGIFRLATPSRLLELTNPSQPLMKRMMIEAPGTYHHSIIVANLAEAAAGKIGANQYLARAGAYYHDIGKLKRPLYFKENQLGSENPHEKTDPYVSAAILISHTVDGALLAQKEHLPTEILDIIHQHHGVTPVMFFYHKALQLANGNHVDINEFRYAGPKPQTKEAAIVMLADTIEAAVRSMKDPTPKSIDQFIERLVRGKLEDGQLSDSPLSLTDIDEICKAFSGILKGVYHERIEYPKVQHYVMQNQQSAEESVKTTEEISPDEQESEHSAEEIGEINS